MARFKSKRYLGVYYQTLKNSDKAYYITYKENNKKVWLKIGLHSEGVREQLCHQKRNEINTKMRLGEDLPEVAKRKAETLNEVAKNFFDEKALHNKRNKGTRARVEKHIQNTLGDIPLNKITKEQINKIQKELSDKLSPASVNFVIGQLNAIFNWAIENELLDKNPCKFVRNIKIDNTRLRYLELEEIKILKKRLENDKLLYYFVILGLSTGGRLQTLCNIKVNDFKENGTIRLYDFKNESEYYGFIDKDLYAEIKLFIESINKKDNDFIFQNTKIENYMNQYYYRQLQPIFDELFNNKVKNLTAQDKVVIHTLRHTFASHLAINNTPILTIKKLMNHSDIKTTMRYAKLSKSNGEDEVIRLTKTLISL
ncbi:tyrosine-type recombinase/integrase [Aliarcobacter cibarius]|uniref:Site-specific tyrosine recombinase, phage integrase family (INT_Rci_Hp1_C domain) n=1 Tax=Aliarcobacter cibarius TaxID=255507 RepID=A0A7L5JQ62_9BACT|nr:tyrosine-type recombinase/integrase [Aliarcobacter cibarius]QKJ27345.1 site-specific tyrosine recombinase, phage integrase family (INT_Rci_Hp1_C domain) [Aliarcobacter cibarius]TLT02932.1 integrase [Aliarcobacter cibarius]